MTLSLKKHFAMPLAALGAVIAITAVSPSMAQARPMHESGYAASYRDGHGDNFDFRRLKHRIWEGQRSGDLSRREARRLKWQVSELEDRADAYCRGGLNGWERRELSERYHNLSERIFVQKHDDDYRGQYRGERSWR